MYAHMCQHAVLSLLSIAFCIFAYFSSVTKPSPSYENKMSHSNKFMIVQKSLYIYHKKIGWITILKIRSLTTTLLIINSNNYLALFITDAHRAIIIAPSLIPGAHKNMFFMSFC